MHSLGEDNKIKEYTILQLNNHFQKFIFGTLLIIIRINDVFAQEL
jgi:hypothetical protein